MQIIELTTLTAAQHQQLQQLLADCVDSGASVGFLAPVATQDLCDYWQGVAASLHPEQRRLWIAVQDQRIVGAVQLSLTSKANGAHRAEVEKLMVARHARGQGISKLLMAALEQSARQLGLKLLILDTRLGDVASLLYRAMGYQEAGQIPAFALSSNGQFDATVFFYKLLR